MQFYGSLQHSFNIEYDLKVQRKATVAFYQKWQESEKRIQELEERELKRDKEIRELKSIIESTR